MRRLSSVLVHCKLTLVCNNIRFIVLLSPSLDKPNFVEKKYQKKIYHLLESKNELKMDAAVDEISGFVATLCHPIFWESASIIGKESPVL